MTAKSGPAYAEGYAAGERAGKVRAQAKIESLPSQLAKAKERIAVLENVIHEELCGINDCVDVANQMIADEISDRRSPSCD